MSLVDRMLRTSIAETLEKRSLYDELMSKSMISRLERTFDPNSLNELIYNALNRKQKFSITSKTKTDVIVRDGVVVKAEEKTERKTIRKRAWW